MPEVQRALTLPFAHGELNLAARRRLGRELQADSYEQAIVLPNSLKSALVPFFAGIPQRTGWRGEMRYGLLNDIRMLDKVALPFMVQRFVALGLGPGETLPERLPHPRLQVAQAAVQQSREEFALQPELPILALCPGAEFGTAKRWPPEYFAELAKQYLQLGWQVLLFGSANDRPLAQAVDLLSLATAVVSNDSGLMHIAAALGRPLLAIYGATSPGFTPPLGTRASLQVSDIDCAPCFQRECPLGHHRCMRETLPVAVADKLQALLAETA
jgi:heptosyltransferase-2